MSSAIDWFADDLGIQVFWVSQLKYDRAGQ